MAGFVPNRGMTFLLLSGSTPLLFKATLGFFGGAARFFSVKHSLFLNIFLQLLDRV